MRSVFPSTYLRFLGPATLCVVLTPDQQVEEASRFAVVAYDQSCAVEFDVPEGWSTDQRGEIAATIGMERMMSTLATHIKATGKWPD